MDASDQAAEQIVRITLQGSEATLRLSGALAKNTAALLVAAARNQHRSKGKTSLGTLLKSEKELSVFQLHAQELDAFRAEAKKYGVLFHMIEKPKDAQSNEIVDMLVRTADASKMNRIYEKLGIGLPEQSKTDKSRQPSRDTASKEGQESPPAERSNETSDTPETRDVGVVTKDEAIDKLAALRAKPVTKESEVEKDPLAKGRTKDHRFEPTSEKRTPSGKATTDRSIMRPEKRPSVKQEIKEIEQEKRIKEQARVKERMAPEIISKQSEQVRKTTSHIKLEKKEER